MRSMQGTQSLDLDRLTTRQLAQLLNDTTDAVISDMAGDMSVPPSAVSSQSPETEIYRMLTGEAMPRNASLMYGESALGNRTRRGMVADALERLGNTLEGAQTNVTRAAAKDLGIQSTGKVVENIRKKTGLTNLETQGTFARELTGGADSLMDNIRVSSLNC